MKIKELTARWMRLLFRLAGRFLIAVVLFFYVSVGATAAISLYKKYIYRAQDIDTINTIIVDSVDNKNLLPVTAWLNARPLAETDKLVDMITTKTGALESGTFFEIFRRQLKLGRPEEALFWLQLGRYRLRYDIIRCKAGPESTKLFDNMLNLRPSPAIETLLKKHPEMLKKALQRVLDFDANYPASDDPTLVCQAISPDPPVDDGDWAGYRRTLRERTEDFIKSPDKVNPL